MLGGLAMANPRGRGGEQIFDNSAVDLFWFRPARDRDRQAIGIVGPPPRAVEGRPGREPFIHRQIESLLRFRKLNRRCRKVPV